MTQIERNGGDPPTSGQMLGLLSDSSLTRLVNDAFRTYQSTLALSRSPLANSALITPTLVVDDVSPTAEERGRGLRLLLRWAVEQIAPHPPTYPLGTFRPFDDPTWVEPLWWRYNILRHRYLEPLHPDDFIEGRFTETLLTLTGITSSDAFFDERNRAIREIAERLRQQLVDGAGSPALRHMALRDALRLLETRSDAAVLLGIAATFDDIFPRSLLLRMADAEVLPNAGQLLSDLIASRLLLTGDEQRNLWLSPLIRHHIYQQQPATVRKRRHRVVANHYAQGNEPLLTAKHLQAADQFEEAANTLFAAAEMLIHELQVTELSHVLQQFDRSQLTPATWREVQILLSDLCYHSGQPEAALQACRHALQAATADQDQARIYRRMGKLYEQRSQLHALTYYQEAVERFAPNDPELVALLKDRGWLHILRHDAAAATKDLELALALAGKVDSGLHADILDALASLHRRQQQFEVALEYARQALSIRESHGNLPRVASSFNSLGNIYREMGEYQQAIPPYEEALAIYRKVGNEESVAGARLNIGSAYFSLGQLENAIGNYHQSLEVAVALGHMHLAATAHYNLTEAHAANGNRAKAHSHWQQGYELSQRAGFADEIDAFEALRTELTFLRMEGGAATATAPVAETHAPTLKPLSSDEAALLTLATRHGRITAKVVTEELAVSRATATRRLRALAEAGHLQQHGKGRGTHYTLAEAMEASLPLGSQPENAAAEQSHPIANWQTDQLVDQLLAQAASLREQFGVIEISPSSIPSGPSTAMPRLAVRFESPPPLADFFRLRRHLTDVLGVEIDLWPLL